MKMRSLIALLLILTLLLVGCGTPELEGGTIRPADGDNVQDTTEQSEDPTEEVNDDPTEEPTVEATESSEQDNQLALGSFEGGIYENTYVGYGCTLGDGWVYKTAEEIQDISDLAKQILEGSEIDQMGGTLSQVTDMMAENADELTSINVQYTLLTTQERLAQALMTEEDMIDGIVGMKDTMVSSYAQAGIEVYSMEKVTVNFLGEERHAVHTVASIQGINYYILQMVDINLGPYYVTLTLASFVEDNTSSLLELFYPLD